MRTPVDSAYGHMRRMAIVAPSAYLFGGVQTWLDYMVSGLESVGWSITVVLVHGEHSDVARYCRQHPFPGMRWVANPTGSREGRVRGLCTVIQQIDPELVLAVNIVDCYEAVARLRRRGGLQKITMALHGLNACFFADIKKYRNSLDGVVATNRLAVQAAVDIGLLPKGRAKYAPCGVEISCEEPDTAVTDDRLHLAFCGRLDDREKRVMDLPRILAWLGREGIDFHLRIAGTGPDEGALRQALSIFAAKVTFMGCLSASELRTSFYRPGDVLLILSPSETGPLVAWEAMAAGMTVVTSRFLGIGLEGSLRDGETCLVFPVGDAEAAAAAVARLGDPVLRSTLALAGRTLVRERYQRDASIHAWDITLQDILQQPVLPPSAADLPAPCSGRLDRYFGTQMAETVRSLLGLRYRHTAPGNEWPHSYGSDNDEPFSRRLAELDQRETQ